MKQFACALLAIAFGSGAVYVDLYHAKNHNDLVFWLALGCILSLFGALSD